MVKKIPLFFALLLILAVTVSAASSVNAQSLTYTVDHEWAQIFINQDGTIDLTYNITLTVTSGVLHGFYVGQPKSDFTPGQAVDQYGNSLNVVDASSGGDYRVDVTLNQPLTTGQSVWFTVTTNVAGMISNDTQNSGNFGMQFIPQWISDTAINDVRVQIVLPPDVAVADVKTTQNFYNGTSTVNGQLAVYWEKPIIQPNEQFLVGVSFPANFLPNYVPSSGGGGFSLGSYGIVIGVVGVLFAIAIFALIIRALSKSSYTSPKVSMESLGVKRGLTAVEASYLLDMKPPQIVTEILYSLLQKRAVWAQETKPSLKLKLLPPFENKTGTKDDPLRYYEIDFLNSLKTDGGLDEEKLAHTIMFLRDTVEQKLQGYSRKDTVDYYRKMLLKRGHKWNKRALLNWRLTLTMSNCCGFCLTPTNGLEPKPCSGQATFSLTHCGSGGGTATQHTIQTQHIRQTLTCQHSLVRLQKFQVQTSPTTSPRPSKKPQTT